MDKRKVEQIRQQYDRVIHNVDDAVARAIESCNTSGITVSDHFREVTKMVELGSGAKRNSKDYMLKAQEKRIAEQAGKLPEIHNGEEDRN